MDNYSKDEEDENKENTCSICLGENADMFKLKCKHYFFITCI